MNILVTGGAGFIGSHLVERLLDDGHDVAVADNMLTGHIENLRSVAGHARLRLFVHDISEPFGPDITDIRFDRVYNLASPASPRGYRRYPLETLRVNSQGTWNALALAQQHGARFLQASTSEVYGDPLIHPQTEEYWGNVNPVGPRACYDEGKRFSESLVTEYVQHERLDARIARIFNTYGPRSHPADGRLVPNFCMQAIRRVPITIYGTGLQTRSFCYVDDLVRGLVMLMETDGLEGQIVNLGNPEEHTIIDLAGCILRLAGSDAGVQHEPLPRDDPRRRRPDVTRARDLLGWQPEIGLDTGLTDTIAYFRSCIPADVTTSVGN